MSILDFLVAILQDDQMNKGMSSGSLNLQRATLRLVTYAYIESADLSPVIIKNRYRNLDRMITASEANIFINFENILMFIKE